MGIETISVRVPDTVKQEIQEYIEEEKLQQTSEAARKLLLIGLEEWHKERALKLLELGRVSFNKAAAIAKMNVWDFAGLVKQRGIVWIKDHSLIDEIKEIVV